MGGINGTVFAAVFGIAAICVMIQSFFKKYLESDQYYYLKDVTLVGAWALCGVWMPEGPMRITIASGIAAACVGFCQRAVKTKHIRCMYFLIGLAFSVFGPRIAFIEYHSGEYYYLSYAFSVSLSTLWIGCVTLFLQEIDETPGLCGLMLTVLWTLVSVIVLISSGGGDVSQLCITGLVLIFVFWSRHIYAYRRLTEPLTAMWGTLLAGITVLGVNKGIAFYTLALLPLGFLAIAAFESVAALVNVLIFRQPVGGMVIYRKFIEKGFPHHTALLLITACSTFMGMLFSFAQFGAQEFIFLVLAALLVLAVTYAAYKITFRGILMSADLRRPVLWGIVVDNISLDYAKSRVTHWLNNERDTHHIIVTPDALAALRSRTDSKYRKIIREASMVLPDGRGLISGLSLLGTPVQERIPGVEFTEHICKIAAENGKRVWILGGEEGVAAAAAKILAEKYPGLIIAGTRNGFFAKEELKSICDEIRASGTDILFVGLGVPKQEYWLRDNIAATGATIGMGIGGSMDVISGRLQRAPKIWQTLGLEWLYRTIQEPWRWRRIAKLPVYVFYLVLTLLHLDRYVNDDIVVKTN